MTSNRFRPLHGTLAAAVTPLRDGGTRLDEPVFGALMDRYAAAGLDGVLALGTTGEGIMLTTAERRRAATLVLEAAAGRLQVAVHCGAQTTAETTALAGHAAESGADAVAVIAPPYFALDPASIFAHLHAAARACAPTPFYVYEFAARSGYAVPLEVIHRLQEAAPNLRGLKVSDTPFERFRPYVLEDLDVFVGPESLIHAGMAAGAAGVVSGLAAAFPELVRDVARSPTAEAAERAGALRRTIDAFPFQAALKTLLVMQGVAIREDCRAPLRGLTPDERARLEGQATAPGSIVAEALGTVGSGHGSAPVGATGEAGA